jgi:outer membrane receptor protein involved in Fe transport
MKKHNFAFRDALGNNVTDGKTKHIGIEAEIATPLIWNFDLAGSGTYARHTYDFTHDITSGPNQTEAIFSGNDVDTAPRTLANVRLGYSFNEGLGRAELEWVHVGAYWMDASNTQRYPGHDLFNLRLDYALTPNLDVFGRIENLANKRYADRADYAFGSDRYFPGDDRGLYVGTTVSF